MDPVDSALDATSHVMSPSTALSRLEDWSFRNETPSDIERESTPSDDEDDDSEEDYPPSWAQPIPKIWKPFLDSFTLFPKLPTEIRQAIWTLTLHPRVIEVEHSQQHGFYTRVPLPTALSVCVDSRSSVQHLYPMCFGNIIQQAAIVFNFSLDTLYIDMGLGDSIVPFIYSLKGQDAQELRSLAVDWDLGDYYPRSDIAGSLELLARATQSMTALKQVTVVSKLDEYWHDHGVPQGNGPIELTETFPRDVQLIMWNEVWSGAGQEEIVECQRLPNMVDVVRDFQAPVKSASFGWRRQTPALKLFPWESSEVSKNNSASSSKNASTIVLPITPFTKESVESSE